MDKEELLKQAIENLGKVNHKEIHMITTTNTMDRNGNKLLTINIESSVEKEVVDYESGFMV